jgi:hypothetical protein
VVPPGRLTEGITLFTTGLGAGLAPGAALVGVVADRSGASSAFWVTVAAGLLGAASPFSLLGWCETDPVVRSTCRPPAVWMTTVARRDILRWQQRTRASSNEASASALVEQKRRGIVDAVHQDGSYPRPQLVREAWKSLDGTWAFAFDDHDLGVSEHWYDVDGAAHFDRDIEVPFPPESPASGVHETGFHSVVWYRRTVTAADLIAPSAAKDRTLLHFGAVDHRARVWFDGVPVGEHVGGQTPFDVDITDLLDNDRAEHVLVVRAEDDPLDAALPRGKQDWQLEPARHLVPPHHGHLAKRLDRDRPCRAPGRRGAGLPTSSPRASPVRSPCRRDLSPRCSCRCR